MVLMVMISGLGCKEETKSPPVDAAVDMGPQCTADSTGNMTCQEQYGERYFCSSSGTCVQLEACEEESCCPPGAAGDEYCLNTFGAGSTCVAGETNGLCSERACPGCVSDSDGHSCCYDALGPNWYCGGEGLCEVAPPCESEDCCVPGPGGDAKCQRSFGEQSECTQLANGGQCLRPMPPPCADCRPDETGHQCCRSEFADDWFCGLEGMCNKSSGCMNPECCIPSEAGDALCAERFGDMSVCAIVEGDGRCDPSIPGQ